MIKLLETVISIAVNGNWGDNVPLRGQLHIRQRIKFLSFDPLLRLFAKFRALRDEVLVCAPACILFACARCFVVAVQRLVRGVGDSSYDIMNVQVAALTFPCGYITTVGIHAVIILDLRIPFSIP